MTLILSGTDGLSDVDGTAATPAIRGTDTNTGIFFPAADTIAFSEGGVEAMRIDSSGNLLVGTTSASTPGIGFISVANTFGFKNRIINGGMVIDQRNAGASQTITGGASTLAFNCDRWQVRSAGANATVQQIVTNNTYRMRFTGAASVSAVAAQQSIEALNCVDLAGGTATLSLVASSTSLTTLTLEAYYANTTNTFGTWGSPTVTSIGTQSVNISTTESTVSWTFSVPSAATTGIQIRITGGALGATQTLTIGNVQLERGSTATSFDFRPYGTELMLCQRYFQVFDSIYIEGYANVGSVRAINAPMTFPVQMRATPTRTVKTAGTLSNVRANSTAYAGLGINGLTATYASASIESAASGLVQCINQSETMSAEL